MSYTELGSNVRERSVGDDAELTRKALEVLEANWLGHATRPSPRLYPHQWSWDSACIAIGYASVDEERARTELRSLFAAQWSNGLLPHIVFSGGGSYFPGPDFWQTERSTHAPDGSATSGIVQPPIHASAVWRVYQHAHDRASATAFLEELLPKLAAWHEYLYRERTRDGLGLAEIWHPWESGMDNSPLWDEALARIELTPEQVPAYERVDVRLADAAERPTDGEYDRYAYLVQCFRELEYEPAAIRETCPFAIRPVLFNSLLVQSGRDLAHIARELGADPRPFEDRAEQTAVAVEACLWDEEQGLYADWDVHADGFVPSRSPLGFAPLYASVPGPERAERALESLAASLVQIEGFGPAAPSLSPADPRFDPNLYWRGPVWPIVQWVLSQGLARYGKRLLSLELRRSMIELCRTSGFCEHYSPTTGRGHGGEQFAWTAALVLDLLREERGEEGEAR
ncbi:MAG: amylo-alpha-1,6-glucosidase [Gaiellaceae bacterium]